MKCVAAREGGAFFPLREVKTSNASSSTPTAPAPRSAMSTASPSSADTITVKRLVDVLLFVGPSGCGKSTIIRQLQREWPTLFEFSVSHTTRTPRQGEVNGKHYHFVSVEEFKQLVKTRAMVEYSRLSSSASASRTNHVGNMYGTSKAAMHAVLDHNHVVLMDTDLLGAINIRRYCAHEVVDAKPVTVQRESPEHGAKGGAAAQKNSASSSESSSSTAKPLSRATKSELLSSRQVECHSKLPRVPPPSSMPHPSRLVRCMVIFIAPPSMEELEERLRRRNSETAESLRMRMEVNRKWMRWAQENRGFFDHYVVNDDLELCCERVKAIVRAEVISVASSL